MDKKKPVGVITERDMIRKVIVPYSDPDRITAEDIMTSPVVSVTEDVTIIAIAQIMKRKHIRRVLVEKNDKLIGIITQSDIMEGMINKIKHLNWQLVHTEISLDEYIESLKKIQIENVKGPKKNGIALANVCS